MEGDRRQSERDSSRVFNMRIRNELPSSRSITECEVFRGGVRGFRANLADKQISWLCSTFPLARAVTLLFISCIYAVGRIFDGRCDGTSMERARRCAKRRAVNPSGGISSWLLGYFDFENFDDPNQPVRALESVLVPYNKCNLRASHGWGRLFFTTSGNKFHH